MEELRKFQSSTFDAIARRKLVDDSGPEEEEGEPRNLFPRLGLGEVRIGDAWNLPSEGTGVVEWSSS